MSHRRSVDLKAHIKKRHKEVYASDINRHLTDRRARELMSLMRRCAEKSGVSVRKLKEGWAVETYSPIKPLMNHQLVRLDVGGRRCGGYYMDSEHEVLEPNIKTMTVQEFPYNGHIWIFSKPHTFSTFIGAEKEKKKMHLLSLLRSLYNMNNFTGNANIHRKLFKKFSILCNLLLEEVCLWTLLRWYIKERFNEIIGRMQNWHQLRVQRTLSQSRRSWSRKQSVSCGTTCKVSVNSSLTFINTLVRMNGLKLNWISYVLNMLTIIDTLLSYEAVINS